MALLLGSDKNSHFHKVRYAFPRGSMGTRINPFLEPVEGCHSHKNGNPFLQSFLWRSESISFVGRDSLRFPPFVFLLVEMMRFVPHQHPTNKVNRVAREGGLGWTRIHKFPLTLG